MSSVGGKSAVARFDGGMLSFNSGVLTLAAVEKRLRVADRLARCIDDPRSPDQIVHSLTDMIGFRMKIIAAGYEDGNDANRLRRCNPIFKMAQDALPSGRDLASQSTVCADWKTCQACATWSPRARRWSTFTACRSGRCRSASFLISTTRFDAVHAGQQLRLLNAHHDKYRFQPVVVFDGAGRFVSALLRPAKWSSGAEIRLHLRRLMQAIRGNWPNTSIPIQADRHYCSR
ncbi:transposase [Phyllobacterium salinisoli]|uniref:transposase n=1 Tax=Phyllobacterium salinisoli TaxID=1899321 RepID=UPI0011C04912|nr:transposase [Phyllobacterium salinisoli]